MATERSPRQVLKRHISALENRQRYLVGKVEDPNVGRGRPYILAEISALSVAIHLLHRELVSDNPIDFEKELSNAKR